MAPQIKTKCNAVKAALKGAEGARADVRTMLSKVVELSVGIRKAERDPIQEKVAEMIKTVLDASEGTLKASVVAEEEKIVGVEAEKGSRATAAESAQATFAEKEAAVSEKKATRDESKSKLDEARESLSEAASAHDSAVAESQTLQSKQKSLHTFQTGTLTALKDGTAMDKNSVKDAQAGLKHIVKEFSLDNFMAESVKDALGRSTSERSTFDGFVTRELERVLAKHFEDLGGELARGEVSVQEHAAQVELAKNTVNAASESLDACTKSLDDAKVEEESARVARNTARAAAKEIEPEFAKMSKACESARGRLEKFKRGALRDFSDLDGDYEDIETVTCDRAMVDLCRRSGDSVSLNAAQSLFAKAAESGDLSRVERWTLRYCMAAFNWAEDAHDFIVEEIKKLPLADAGEPQAKRGRPSTSYYRTVDGVKCDASVIDECNKAVAGVGDGRVSVDDAKGVFGKIADGGKVTITEKWTLRYCLTEYKWTAAAVGWIQQEIMSLQGVKSP